MKQSNLFRGRKAPRVKSRTEKGTPFSKIIRTITRDGREYQLHATKGWRSYRTGEN